MSSRVFSLPTVSVIVPVYRWDARFARCLECVSELEPSAFEVLVAVDGGDEKAVRASRDAGFRTVPLATRRGPAFARNEAARLATGEVLFFLDADVAVRPDAVSRVANQLSSDSDLAAVIGSYDDDPAEQNFLSQYKNLQHHWVHQTSAPESGTFWGACGAIRRSVFLELGGFDERYTVPCIEDIELGVRAVRQGHSIRLDKHLQVKHLKSWDVGSLISSDFACRAVPWTELIWRTGQMPNALNLKWSGRLSVVLALSCACCAALSSFWPPAAVLAAMAFFAIVVLNRDLYEFFLEKRGATFFVGAVSWHLIHFLYSGFGFACGTVRHFISSDPLRRAAPMAVDPSMSDTSPPQES